MKKLIFVFSCLLVVALLRAQEIDEVEIVEIEELPSDTVLHEPSSVLLLYDTRPIFSQRTPTIMPVTNSLTDMFLRIERQFQDPRAPRFILINRKSTMALGIGGYVKGTVSVDFKGIADSKDFVTNTIPTPGNPAQNGQYQMDASTSRIFLSLVGNNRFMGDFTVYLESDFRGGSAGNAFMQLRQAYIDMRDVKAGLAWSTFTDVAAGPPTIDNQGPCGIASERNVILQYHPHIGKHWSMAVAVESPDLSVTVSPQYTQNITQRMPDIPMYVQYSWGDAGSHVRASGIVRGLSYRNLVEAKNKMKIGWGVQLSGVANISDRLILYYDGVYGRGISEYINDLGGGGYDLIPMNVAGKMTAPQAWGAMGGVQVNITSQLFASATYSQCRLYDGSDGVLSPGTYRYAQYVVGNLFYNITKDCQIGVEYLYGRRVDRDNIAGSACRINAAIQYNF